MPSRLERSHRLTLSGAPALVADLESRVAVIVTHPWGPLGGNMNNNVVAAAVLYFQQLGVTTLRFDFVGSQIGRGHRQVQQVEEAANYLLTGKHVEGRSRMRLSRAPAGTDRTDGENNAIVPSSILLVGYSYGSLISASASASISRCAGVISIAPPIAVKHWLLFFNGEYHMTQARKRTALPRLLILGSNDNFTSEDVFFRTVQSYPTDSTTGAILKDADHFFHRRETDLMNVIGQWLLTTFPELNGDLSRLAQMELPIDFKEVISEMFDEEKTLDSPQASSCRYDCAGLASAWH